MKTMLLTLVAMLTVSVASAQVNTVQPQQADPNPAKDVIDNSNKRSEPAVAVPIDPNTNQGTAHSVTNDGEGKDDLKTNDHIKSTPQPGTLERKDTATEPKVKKKRKKQ